MFSIGGKRSMYVAAKVHARLLVGTDLRNIPKISSEPFSKIMVRLRLWLCKSNVNPSTLLSHPILGWSGPSKLCRPDQTSPAEILRSFQQY